VNRTRLGNIVRARLLDHFELFLTTAGVVMAVLLTFSELTRGERGLAVVALVWLQGFILWAAHRHAWFRQRAVVRKLRVMLQDRVNNQLTVMLGAAESRGRGLTLEERQDLEVAVVAAKAVSMELENLSLESLRQWERQYGRGLRMLIP
jgi:hypothetical protein